MHKPRFSRALVRACLPLARRGGQSGKARNPSSIAESPTIVQRPSSLRDNPHPRPAYFLPVLPCGNDSAVRSPESVVLPEPHVATFRRSLLHPPLFRLTF